MNEGIFAMQIHTKTKDQHKDYKFVHHYGVYNN
jgi:hypothetical protein